MTLDALKKKFKTIAAEHDVVVRFHKGPKEYGGYYNSDRKSMVVVLDHHFEKDWPISAFFHELAHVLDHRDGLYADLYDKRSSLRKKRFLALRAERHTDDRGAALCRKYFKKVKFFKAYSSAAMAEAVKDFYSSYYY